MTNTEIVQAIITNIENQITSLGAMLESTQQQSQARDAPLARIELQSIDFGDSYGEHPYFDELVLSIHLEFWEDDADVGRDKQTQYAYLVRENFTVEDLNVGDLLNTRTVTHVQHVSAVFTREIPFHSMEFVMRIRYKNEE